MGIKKGRIEARREPTSTRRYLSYLSIERPSSVPGKRTPSPPDGRFRKSISLITTKEGNPGWFCFFVPDEHQHTRTKQNAFMTFHQQRDNPVTTSLALRHTRLPCIAMPCHAHPIQKPADQFPWLGICTTSTPRVSCVKQTMEDKKKKEEKKRTKENPCSIKTTITPTTARAVA